VAVKIKLKRMGKIREPYYRIIVADARTKRDGRAIEEIGKYHPKADPSFIEVNSDRAQHWLSVGAQPTDPVRKILEITGDWQKFKGLPGAEGTLRTAATRADKKEAFAAALAETLADSGATTPKGGGRGKSSGAKGDAKAGDAKAGGPKSGDAKAGGPKAGDAKAGGPKAGGAKAGDAKAGDAKAGDAKADDAKAADAKAADATAGDAKAADATAGDAKAADATAGDAKAADATAGDAKADDATAGDAKAADAKADKADGEKPSGQAKSDGAGDEAEAAGDTEVTAGATSEPGTGD
jgi:small subunit ribosomal protein S16